MIKLTSAGVSIDKGVIPPLRRVPFKLSVAGISIDKGLIPPKNFFKSKISNAGISLGVAPEGELNYQVTN